MKSSDELQDAFVLHTRPWRETSMLVDVFTRNHGKLGLCARGVRSKKSLNNSLLQPLTPLLLCWKGRGELPLLTVIEPAAQAIKLSGNALYCAFYMNELLVRLLHRHDPHSELFEIYHKTLKALVDVIEVEAILRQFELKLLLSLGYGLPLQSDINGHKFTDSNTYLFHQDGYFQQILDNHEATNPRVFDGKDLISIAENNWQNSNTLKAAKRLLRLSLIPLLGDKPLQSRKLFRRKIS